MPSGQKRWNAFCGMLVWVFWYWGEISSGVFAVLLVCPGCLGVADRHGLAYAAQGEGEARLEALESALHDSREHVRCVEPILEANSSVTDDDADGITCTSYFPARRIASTAAGFSSAVVSPRSSPRNAARITRRITLALRVFGNDSTK